MDPQKELARQEAERLWRRGLLIGQEAATAEGLSAVAGLWQRAIELYRGAGEPEKAAAVEAALSRLASRLLDLPKRVERAAAGEGSVWSRGRLGQDFKAWHSFLTIGCFGFGGPMAVWSILHDEMVKRRKVLSNRDFLEAAVLGDILPGPVTMDIVTYTGYKLRRWWGALLATLLFVLPSFIFMVVIAAYYDQYIGVPMVQKVFHALGAAVTAIVICVGLDLGREQVKSYAEVGIFLWAFVSSLIFRFDMFVVVTLAGLAGLVLEAAYPAARQKT